ncbi:unnamed protein product [Protopolystoma xenopodis]|uniref:Uncharacterized protein n=1 Tax=Protopolystoma xenopodis TaxID=117903 RepID=A0A3S4ZLY2_9PLAT|nr:unnamed protein product [Protopolystoma xenopodis]
MLRIARLTDDADYEAGETSGNVPRPRACAILILNPHFFLIQYSTISSQSHILLLRSSIFLHLFEVNLGVASLFYYSTILFLWLLLSTLFSSVQIRLRAKSRLQALVSSNTFNDLWTKLPCQTNNNSLPALKDSALTDISRASRSVGPVVPQHCPCANCALISRSRRHTPRDVEFLSPELGLRYSPNPCEIADRHRVTKDQTFTSDQDSEYLASSERPVESDNGRAASATIRSPSKSSWAWDTVHTKPARAPSPWLPSGTVSPQEPFRDHLGRLIQTSKTISRLLGYNPTSLTHGSEEFIRSISPRRFPKCVDLDELPLPDGEKQRWKISPAISLQGQDSEDKLPTGCVAGQYQLRHRLPEPKSDKRLMNHPYLVNRSYARSPSFLRPRRLHTTERTIHLTGSTSHDTESTSFHSPKTGSRVRAQNHYGKRVGLSNSPIGHSSRSPGCAQRLPRGSTMGPALESLLFQRKCLQRVISFNFEDGIFYPGLVVRCLNNDAAIIRLRHNGKLCEIPNQLTLPIVDMSHTQTLLDADTVLVRVKNIQSNCECWVPGRLVGGFLGFPDPRMPLRFRYRIRLFTGAKVSLCSSF